MQNLKQPEKKCNDNKCPFHGSLTVHGRAITATVVSARMQKTVVVEWIRPFYIAKYERYEQRRSRIKAHNPDCMNAHEGDVVRIMECRPLSKMKNFVVIDILAKVKGYKQIAEAMEEAKTKKKDKKQAPKEGEENAAS